ncbi:hypothetical protein DMB66_26525 [Actinoplanes sp. ATCC 53533]|uniref:hypothetical protein n=1 Tax=Actinoplanes sp. ATCC 53533 TaxID=1288362 RepID=UPI000F797767|nr:hypothetical protein [Actinoplanes sp. ATCC 53533]RSM59808.1 hypothetical protein DMB66_26525 [Actinoplanes sp. ATCC 53533]
MRILLRAGAIALAASSVLLGGGVAAHAAPADAVTVQVTRLILEPAEAGHAGVVRITVRNTGSEPFSGGVTITEPIADTLETIEGTSGCGIDVGADARLSYGCGLDDAIAPGATAVVRVHFRSPAAPQSFARIAPLPGSVQVGDVTAEFPALFRATSGSLRTPQPYVQDTVGALAVTASDVTLTRQPDGTFAGPVRVTVRNNGDAAHRGLGTAVAVPAGVDGWPGIEPSAVCVGLGDELPVPPGGSGVSCGLEGGQLAEGHERTFEWILTAPAETAAGPLGTGTTLVELSSRGAEQSDNANIDTFSITIAD